MNPPLPFDGPRAQPDDATAEVSAATQRSHNTAASIPKGTSFGRYVVLEPLGEGGMGVVYAAYDPELDRRVALKLLQPSAASDGNARMLREAQAMARLSHPNVIPVHDVGSFDGRVFITMELVEGQTLREWAQLGLQPWRQVLEHYLDAGRGLHAAHLAGLVHRDFKPANVLLGKDGRVRVMDFGLARSAEHPTLEEVPPADWRPGVPTSLVDSELTAAGVILGTVAYMAPEQFTGPADARSDQFSFCVALYEALYGERPFRHEEPALRAWKVLPAPKDSRVPGWVRSVLLRGLSVEPAARHPSMLALVDALGNDPAMARRRWVGAGAAAFLALTGVGLVLHQSSARGSVCRDGDRRLQNVWDGPRKEAVRRAFLASGRPAVEGTLRRVEGYLDTYAEGWVAMNTDACLATRVRGEQTDEVLSLRTTCLDQRLQGLESLTAALAQADGATVDASLRAAASLPGLDACAQVAQLRARVRPPKDVATARRVEGVKKQLADVRASLALAQYPQGVERATAALQQARAIQYRPLEAETLEVLGSLQEKSSHSEQALQSFYDALLAAQAGGDDVLAASASTGLSRVELARANFELAQKWGRYTESTIERIGAQPRIEAAQEMVLGLVALAEHRIPEGVSLCQRALTLRVKAYGPEHPEVAESYNSLGRALYLAARDEDSLGPLKTALAIWERTLGPDHPDTAQALFNLGNSLEQLGRMQESLDAHQRALAIRKARLNPDHADLALSLGRVSALEARLGMPEHAVDEIREAIRISLKVYGPRHPLTAEAYRSEGYILTALARFDEAVGSYRHSLAANEAVHGKLHPTVGLGLMYVGNALVRAGRMAEALTTLKQAVVVLESLPSPDLESLGQAEDGLGGWYQANGQPMQAVPHYQRALELKAAALGPENPQLALHYSQLGSALIDAKRCARALPLLERSLALAVPGQTQPGHMGQIKFRLARALWETYGDRRRALRLALEAREALSHSPYVEDRTALAKWLAQRPSAGN